MTLAGTGLPAGVSLGTATAAGTIADDDRIEASVTVAQTVVEGEAAQFTVTLTGGTSTAEVEVIYTVGGTVTAGTDYTAPGEPLELTIPAGDSTGTISIPILDDGVLDPGETLTVTLSSATTMAGSATVGATAASATITVADSGTVTVSVAAVAPTVTEGEAFVFTVTLSGAVASDLAFDWSTADGTATAGDDYTAVPSGTVTFVTGGSLTQTISVTTLRDLLAEGNETFTVTLATSGSGLPAGVSLGTATATATISDDDPLEASVAADAGTVTEGEAAQFTVTLTSATSTAAVVVSYTVGGTATAGTDYTAPGEPRDADHRRGREDRDDLDPDPGRQRARPRRDADGDAERRQHDGRDRHRGLHRGDDHDHGPRHGDGFGGPGEARPRATTVVFIVTLSGAVASDVALGWSTADGTATVRAMTTTAVASDGTVTFVAGESLTRTISVMTREDAVAEGNETFTVTLAAPSTGLPAGVSLGKATATGTVEDDDERGIALRPTALTVREGGGGTWEVALASEPTGTVTVDVSSGSTDATVEPSQLTFTSADWNAFQSVTVRVTDDDAVEADATVNLSHTASGADYAAQTATVEMTIPGFEDDDDGTVTFRVPETGVVTVPEGTSAPGGVQVWLPDGVATTTVVVIRAVVELAPVGPPPGFQAGNTVVDIELRDGATLPPGTTATVCFPAGGNSERPRVWRNDASATAPEWVELAEPEGGSPGGLVCGETGHFSWFAVGSASRPEVSDRRASVAKAWLARSGRTIAQHVLAGLQERLRAPREAGFEGALAGRGLDTSGAGWRDGRLPARAGTREDEWRDGRDGPARSDDAVTLRDLVTGSAFRVGAGSDETGFGEVWGRGAHSFVGGTDADLRLDGEVTTGTVGADYQRGRWTGGAALSHSEAEADYRSDAEEGRVGVSLTGVYPYAGFEVTDRVSVWGAGGYGEGDLQVEPDEGERAKTDIRLTMVAAGLRGTLVKRADGFEAAAKADVLQVRTTSTETAELEAAEGRVRRVRVGLEGARPFALDNGASVTPELELGVRHDGGDAETGFGMDLGAGLKWSAPGLRLSGELDVRGLLVHEDEDFEEWTVSGAVRHAPATPSGRGLSYSLTQSWGAPGAGGGADRLWARETLPGLGAGGGGDSGARLEAEVGYGFSVLGSRGVTTPHAGLSRGEERETLTLGQRLKLGASQWRVEAELGADDRTTLRAGYDYRPGADFDLRFEATRREPAGAGGGGAPEHGITLQARIRW